MHVLHAVTTECPECKGKKRVPMHHGLRDEDLRDRECPWCGGRGWVKSHKSRPWVNGTGLESILEVAQAEAEHRALRPH